MSNCLRVYGLGEKTNEEEITMLFSRFGKLSNIAILKDKFTRQLMGFTLVYFAQSVDAKAQNFRSLIF